MIHEAEALDELRDCLRRAGEAARRLAYARLDERWVRVHGLLESLVTKVDALAVTRAVNQRVEYREVRN